MIERIIILSGKIKGVAKCVRGSDGIMFCEFASSKPMDIIVSYDDNIIMHNAKHSGEKCIMGQQTAQNIGIVIMDGSEITSYGKCGNGKSASILAAYAENIKKERSLSEREKTEKKDIDIAKESSMENDVIDSINTTVIELDKNTVNNQNNITVDEIVLQKEINEFINEEPDIIKVEKDISLSINNETASNSEVYNETQIEIVPEVKDDDCEDLFLNLTPIEKSELLEKEDNHVTSNSNNDIAKHCGRVCERMMNDRFENDNNDNVTPFYVKIAEQLKNLFDTYPHDKALEEIVHESSWVRIPFGDDEYYVVGVISEAEKPIFICYGLPRDKRDNPCPELTQHAEWLPSDRANVDGCGYWVMYQDAVSGENF